MNNIFDTHAHYSSRQFDADRAELLTALPRAAWSVCWNVPRIPAMLRRFWSWRTPRPTSHAALGIHRRA